MKYTTRVNNIIYFEMRRKAYYLLMVTVLAGLTLCASISPLSADEGRTPIYQPTTITQSGHYIITRNISVTSGDAITIQANEVTLDLNGKTIASSSTSGYLIAIANGYSNITIRNGFLAGGSEGVHYSNSSTRTRLYLENLAIRNSASYGMEIFGAEHVDVISCRIYSSGSSGIYLHGGSALFSGSVINSSVNGAGASGIELNGLTSGEVRGNTVLNFGTAGYSHGISLNTVFGQNAKGNLVDGNTVSGGGSDDAGITIAVGSAYNLIINNTITSNGIGISVNSNGNSASRNLIANHSSHGIEIYGNYNLIEQNQIVGNGTGGSGFGIAFGSAGSNAYRNNMLRNNISGPVFGGNTDAGGNII